MPNNSKLKIYAFRLFVGLLCIFPIYDFFFKPCSVALNRMARGSDAEEAGNLRNYITGQFSFEQRSLWDSNQPPVYIHPSNHGLRVDLYGVTNSETQKRLLMLVHDWQVTNTYVTELQVRFFGQEQPRGYQGQHVEPLLKEVAFSIPSATPR